MEIADLALPKYEDLPAGRNESFHVFLVSLHVASEFWNPIFGPRTRKPTFPAFSMLMPKAAMNKNGPFQSSKHDIRFARKILGVEPVAEAERVQKLTDGDFRLGVLRFDPAHVLGAARRIEGIGHRLLL